MEVKTKLNKLTTNPLMRKSSNLRAIRGGVLIDTMFALFIAALGTIGFLSLSVASNVAHQSAIENTAACNAGRQVLENTRVYKGAILASGEYDQTKVLSLGKVPQLASLINPNITMSITDWRTRVKQVKVTITWTSNNASGASKSKVIVGLVTSKGLAE